MIEFSVLLCIYSYSYLYIFFEFKVFNLITFKPNNNTLCSCLNGLFINGSFTFMVFMVPLGWCGHRIIICSWRVLFTLKRKHSFAKNQHLNFVWCPIHHFHHFRQWHHRSYMLSLTLLGVLLKRHSILLSKLDILFQHMNSSYLISIFNSVCKL